MSPILVTKQQSAPNIDPGSYVMALVNVREVQVDDFENPGQKADRIASTTAPSASRCSWARAHRLALSTSRPMRYAAAARRSRSSAPSAWSSASVRARYASAHS